MNRLQKNITIFVIGVCYLGILMISLLFLYGFFFNEDQSKSCTLHIMAHD